MADRYEVRVIRNAGAGLVGLEEDPALATFSEWTEAHRYAASEATRYELGCAVVDTELQVIDWGLDPSDPPTVWRYQRQLITDYSGQRIE